MRAILVKVDTTILVIFNLFFLFIHRCHSDQFNGEKENNSGNNGDDLRRKGKFNANASKKY